MEAWTESPELVKLMTPLSAQQRAALRPVAETMIQQYGKRGRAVSLNKLFSGQDKICNKTTYYRKPDGWHHLPEWNAALNQYVLEYGPHYRTRIRERALRILEEAALKASEKQVALLNARDEQVRQRAIKEVLDRVGVGHDEQSTGGVQVIIENASWTPV